MEEVQIQITINMEWFDSDYIVINLLKKFFSILLIMLLQLSDFPTLAPLHTAPPTLSGNPPTLVHVHGTYV